MTGMRRKSLSRVMYFNIFIPLASGRSTSASMISISDPSAFSASITCLADLTEVTVKHHIFKVSSETVCYSLKEILIYKKMLEVLQTSKTHVGKKNEKEQIVSEFDARR